MYLDTGISDAFLSIIMVGVMDYAVAAFLDEKVDVPAW
jgi:hypothetical protein